MKMALRNKCLVVTLATLTIFLIIVSAKVTWLHWLAFIWILPFAFMLSRLKPKEALVISTLCASLFWAGTSYWLIAANVYFAQSATLTAAVVFTFFCLWQSLPYVALAVSYSHFNWKDSALGPLLAASTLAISWTLLPSPLPWIPQNSLYVYPKFLAILDLSGMSLLIFISTLFCFSIEYASRKNSVYRKQYISCLLAIPLLMLGYGELRQAQIDNLKANAPSKQWLHIGYIQPALHFDDSFDKTYDLTERLIQSKKPDLIVWPEISSPYSFIDNKKDNWKTRRLTKQYQQDIIAVSGYVLTGKKASNGDESIYNQAQLIKSGTLHGTYSKEILVPFFEYMPSLLSFLRTWMPNTQYYQAGSKDQLPLSYKNDIKLAMVICYEVIFPEFTRKKIAQGGNILINPSSDAIFKGGPGHFYHLSTAYLRSIENRVPWVRATNTGTSLIVGADGKIVTQPSATGKVVIDSGHVFIPEKTSIYSQIGNWFILFLLVAWVLYFAFRKNK